MEDFQSYLSPCLTRQLSDLSLIISNFQSYLSPCLTRDPDLAHIVGIRFQSYLSPCLTRKVMRLCTPEEVPFNPTLVRV